MDMATEIENYEDARKIFPKIAKAVFFDQAGFDEWVSRVIEYLNDKQKGASVEISVTTPRRRSVCEANGFRAVRLTPKGHPLDMAIIPIRNTHSGYDRCG